MKEISRLIIVFLICFLTAFLLRKTGPGFEHAYVLVIAAGLAVYSADFMTRRFFPDDVMSFVLGVILGGILSWTCSQWILSLTFLSGFLERLSWRPFLEVFLAFMSVLWIASGSSGSFEHLLFRQNFQEKHFKRLYILLTTLAASALAVVVLSKLQTQGLWQGRAVSDWMLSMAQGNYDFQLDFQKSMNAAPVILSTGLAAFLIVIWIFRRHCLPYAGLAVVLFIFAGFLNHLLLEISGDVLSQWMPSDLLQLFILFNAFYLGSSWGLHVIQRKDFRRF